MKNTLLKFGFSAGAILFVGFYASHLLLGTSPDNYGKGELVGYSLMLVSTIMILLGLKEHKSQQGYLTFGQGMGLGTGINLIAASIFAIYNWVYLKWVHPDFTAEYMAYSEQQIRASGNSQMVIEQQLAELLQYADLMGNIYLQSAVMFATVFFIGLAVTLVGSLALKQPQP